MAAPALSIAIAEKRFGADPLPLYAGFRLEVAAGERLALLGPSGIGKSSLLRLVAGIDRQFSGRIDVGGMAADRAPAPGFVFQDARLLPWLSVADNVRLAHPALSVDAVETMLADAGLAGHGAVYPAQLSGGMQRRAALARALAAPGRLLLLDEPFVSLDAALVGEMTRLVLAQIERHRPTLLLVSHAVEDAARLADRVVVLAGRPAQIVLDLRFPVAAEHRGAADITDHAHHLRQALGEQSGVPLPADGRKPVSF